MYQTWNIADAILACTNVGFIIDTSDFHNDKNIYIITG